MNSVHPPSTLQEINSSIYDSIQQAGEGRSSDAVGKGLDEVARVMFEDNEHHHSTTGDGGDAQFPHLFPFPPPMTVTGGGQPQLVRGIALVQDMEDSIGFYEAPPQTLFQHPSDTTASGGGCGGSMVAVDAAQVYLVPVPGLMYEVPAAVTATSGSQVSSSRNRVRGRDEDGEGEHGVILEGGEEEEVVVAGQSSPLGDDDASRCRKSRLREPSTGAAVETASQPAEAAMVPASASAASAMTVELNLPHDALHPSLQCACVATILCSSSAAASSTTKSIQTSAPRINDVLEVIGYFCDDDRVPTAPSGSRPSDDFGGMGFDDASDFAQWRCNQLPTSIVRTLMCVAVRKISTTASLPSAATCTSEQSLVQSAVSQRIVEEGRVAAHTYLTQSACGGDSLLASYLLLQLCSNVTYRGDGGLPIGDLPIHCLKKSSSDSGAFTKRIAAAARLVTSTAAVAATKAEQHRRLVPYKDMERNFLVAGLLQLAPGTHLSLDLTEVSHANRRWKDSFGTAAGNSASEVKLPKLVNDVDAFVDPASAAASAGEESSSGVPSQIEPSLTTVLESLVHRQQLGYNYLYTQVEVETNISVLVVSSWDQTVLSALSAGVTGGKPSSNQQPQVANGADDEEDELVVIPNDEVERNASHEGEVGSKNVAPSKVSKKLLLQRPHRLLKRMDGLLDLPLTIPLDHPQRLETDLPCDGASSSSSAGMDGGDPQLTLVRAYFAAVRAKVFDQLQQDSATSTAISDALLKEKEEFPERFNNSPLIHNNTMSMRMSLAKCVALSRGCSTLTMSHWEEARELERQRVDRCIGFLSTSLHQ